MTGEWAGDQNCGINFKNFEFGSIIAKMTVDCRNDGFCLYGLKMDGLSGMIATNFEKIIVSHSFCIENSEKLNCCCSHLHHFWVECYEIRP